MGLAQAGPCTALGPWGGHRGQRAATGAHTHISSSKCLQRARDSASCAPPAGPMPFPERLRAGQTLDSWPPRVPPPRPICQGSKTQCPRHTPSQPDGGTKDQRGAVPGLPEGPEVGRARGWPSPTPCTLSLGEGRQPEAGPVSTPPVVWPLRAPVSRTGHSLYLPELGQARQDGR